MRITILICCPPNRKRKHFTKQKRKISTKWAEKIILIKKRKGKDLQETHKPDHSSALSWYESIKSYREREKKEEIAFFPLHISNEAVLFFYSSFSLILLFFIDFLLSSLASSASQQAKIQLISITKNKKKKKIFDFLQKKKRIFFTWMFMYE